MLRDPVTFAVHEASMLADLAQLTPGPGALATMLGALGYQPEAFGTGLFAPGDAHLPALLFPLYERAGLAVRKRQLVGFHISRSGGVAAGLAALRSLDVRPPLLFLSAPHGPPPDIPPGRIVSLEGGVVPRIWRRCFGSFDAVIRVTGQRSHPGLSNTAVNAVETAVPILQALLHLKADIQLRSAQRGHFADAPLQPRLTISAAHGGTRGSALPTVFDILVNRRYDPAESVGAALDEIRAGLGSGLSRSLRVDVAMTEHDPPVADPDMPNRSREERALAAGWGWPQVRFCATSRLVPGAIVLGGLERPDHDSEADDASTTLDEMAALARTLRALLLDGQDVAELRWPARPPTPAP